MRKIITFFTIVKKRIGIIFKVIFTSENIFEHNINKSKIIIIACEFEEPEFLSCYSDEKALNQAIHKYIDNKRNTEALKKAKTKKNRITIEVKPLN